MLPQTLNQNTSSASVKRTSLASAPLSPVTNMSLPQRTSSTDSTADNIRKRVCKACDRCRMKKSKCDGSHPCTRCKADNAICVFGERKKSHDKVYPKGYVEMLEQQQAQLVAGLQELYRRSLLGQSWAGPPLSEATGQPLTHDILSKLDVLEKMNDGSDQYETFEEDLEKLQRRLVGNGAGYVRRRESFSSDSDHSIHGLPMSSSKGTPPITKASVFQNFALTPSPSPLAQSPVPRHRQSYPPAQQSPLHRNPPISNNDPQLFDPEWSMAAFSEPEALLRSRYAMQTPQLQDLDSISDIIGNQRWNDSELQYSPNPNFMSYPQQPGSFLSGMQTMSEFSNGLDNMDVDFQNFISVGSS